jgi:hypothetical protein
VRQFVDVVGIHDDGIAQFAMRGSSANW